MKKEDYSGRMENIRYKDKYRTVRNGRVLTTICDIETTVYFVHGEVPIKAQGIWSSPKDKYNKAFARDLSAVRAWKKIYDKIENYLIKYEATKSAEVRKPVEGWQARYEAIDKMYDKMFDYFNKKYTSEMSKFLLGEK